VWAERVATAYGYSFEWREIGPADEMLGAPSQMVIFDRQDDARAAHETTARENGTENRTESGKEATA
jgi:hypothetical protein